MRMFWKIRLFNVLYTIQFAHYPLLPYKKKKNFIIFLILFRVGKKKKKGGAAANKNRLLFTENIVSKM